MTPEDLKLLFKAMSLYLPYDLLIEQPSLDEGPLTLDGLCKYPMLLNDNEYGSIDYKEADFGYSVLENDINDWESAFEFPPKPYLRRYSDLSIHELKELCALNDNHLLRIDYLISHKIDIFGLIDKGLAIREKTKHHGY